MLEGKSRGIKNVTLASAGEMRSRDDLITEKLYSTKRSSRGSYARGSYAWKSFRNQQAQCTQ